VSGAASDLPKLASPAQRALASIRVSTLKQLSRHTREDIAALHGMGPNALMKLDAALADAGLSFAARVR
jgi:hypothetical protein